MIQKANTIKQKPSTHKTGQVNEVATINAQLGRDVMVAVLIVSILANLFVVTTWIMLQVTSRYDTQLASFFVDR